MISCHDKTLREEEMRLYIVLLVVLSAIVIVGTATGTPEASDKTKKGYTVAELYSKMDELNGKEVTVRGKVVKYNGGIMGRNWIHVQDGTGGRGTNDLTVTSHQSAKVGDKVVATGILIKDKDFGSGYRYDVVLEKASITVE